MKKNYLLGLLFFSGLWGMSEAGLGGVLYRAHIPHASVPLTVIGFIILSLARVYLPQKGSSTLIGAIAMLYKFLNAPFFACHLLAIFLLGLSYDVVFSFFKVGEGRPTPARRVEALFGLSATYLGYILFALTITYVFRYHYWTKEGLPRILRYIGIGGTMASLGNYLLVPRALRLGQRLKEKAISPFELKPGLLTAERKIIRTAIPPLRDYVLISVVSLITAVLWILGVMRCF